MTTTLLEKTELSTAELNQGISDFIQLFKDGVEAWVKAGQKRADLFFKMAATSEDLKQLNTNTITL